MGLIDKKKFLEYLDNDCHDVIEDCGDYADFGYSDKQIEAAINFAKVDVPTIEWHKVTKKPLTEETKALYEELGLEYPEYFLDCDMPDSGEEILIATKWGVDKDICYNDWYYGIGLEGRGDWDGVLAWAKMPKYEDDEEN